MSGPPPAREEQEESSMNWGLGYHGSGHEDDSNGHGSAATTTGTCSIDEMMKHYMQQCLEFHYEQEAKRRQEATVSAASTLREEQQESCSHFVQGASQKPSGSDLNSKEGYSIAVAQSNVVNGPPHADHNNTAHQPSGRKNHDDKTLDDKKQTHTQEQIQAARARAKAILERFQQQQEKFLSPTRTGTTDICCHIGSETPPGFFAQQRQRALQREQERKQQFWEKNCHYAVAREQQRLAQQAQQLQHTTAWHEQYQAALQERQKTRYEQQKLARSKATILQSKEGIGTTVRQKLDRKQQQKQFSGRSVRTVAVYVSGFPTDGSIDEDFAKALFGSYGTIQSVHFYQNKTTGQLKGDALIVYKLSAHESDDDDDATVLLTTVCQQMNGAELPGGNTLSVEPSHSNQNREGTAAAIPTPNTSNTSPLSENKPAAENQLPKQDADLPNGSAGETSDGHTGKGGGDDDDLDDFFSSL